MRILFVNCLFPPIVSGGYEIECRQVADMLSHAGHEVFILTSNERRQEVQKEEVSYPVFRSLHPVLPFSQPATSSLRWRKTWTRLRNEAVTADSIRHLQPEIVFLWSQLRIGMGPARAAQKLNIPYAWRIGDEFLAGFRPAAWEMSLRGLWRYGLDSRLLKGNSLEELDFTFVSSISQFLVDSLGKKGIPFGHVEVIPKGIPLERFPLKKELGTLSQPARLLYTGRLHPEKGVHTLIRAAQQVAKTTPLEVTLVGTGADAYVAQLEAEAAAGSAVVSFIGHVPYAEIPSLYRAHDLFVLPSIIGEGLPSTLQEAMASGLPIVSSGHGGQGEHLVSESNALLFPAGDEEVLARQIQRLLTAPELRLTLARGARKTAEEQFSLKVYGERTERFLAHVYESRQHHI